jgi:hypothetical protein
MNNLTFKIGDDFYCKYPQHGNRNILTNQQGKVVAVSKDGKWLTIERANNTFRSLLYGKMVEARKVTS